MVIDYRKEKKVWYFILFLSNFVCLESRMFIYEYNIVNLFFYNNVLKY